MHVTLDQVRASISQVEQHRANFQGAVLGSDLLFRSVSERS